MKTRGVAERVVKLWTVQSVRAVERLGETGVMQCDAQFVDPCFHDPYRWMAGQLSQKNGLPPNGVKWPIWAWVVRPDLRTSGFAKRGTPCALLQFEADRSQVLLSDFDAWHAVLNDHHYFATDDEFERYQRKLDFGRARRATVATKSKLNSWQGIFVERPEACTNLVQAVLWQVFQAQVRRITYFSAR